MQSITSMHMASNTRLCSRSTCRFIISRQIHVIECCLVCHVSWFEFVDEICSHIGRLICTRQFLLTSDGRGGEREREENQCTFYWRIEKRTVVSITENKRERKRERERVRIIMTRKREETFSLTVNRRYDRHFTFIAISTTDWWEPVVVLCTNQSLDRTFLR
jgi:hypothetical protein